jgi:hypothetical protein
MPDGCASVLCVATPSSLRSMLVSEASFVLQLDASKGVRAVLVGVCSLCITNFVWVVFGVVVRSYLRSHDLAIDFSFQDSGEAVQAILQAATGDGAFVIGCGGVHLLIVGSGG